MTSFEKSDQYIQGAAVASFLDEFFRRRGWHVEPTTPHEERAQCLGDRHFTRDGRHFFVEYKSGIQTYYTGNVFLETISVDSQNKPGWVYTCQADFLFYATLMNGTILIFRPDSLRKDIERLKWRYPERPTKHNQNKGYNTHGLLVPYADALTLTHQTIQVPKP